MKPLLPTLKERKRYLVYELLSEKPLTGAPDKEVLAHLKDGLGLFDGAKAGLLAVKYDSKLQTGIIRMSHDSVDKVKAALMLLQHAGKQQVVPRVRGVSGILKKTERFLPTERSLIIQ
ncbi:hypothetical protein GOV07_03965 [Candidatus Woesearchaeota archaeon]|nr:hypothetical protein [Candidatus Woesearchaeota archaeon]